ncbi:tRNA (N(6)-L-threonylcarbamoyladenosine(37)-C(2))-methylthiotransferase MtaB [Desulfurivibrio dismutans]|uniref:tRNA (N(6)-L-threonylcarbamoyladenosine(37)-C(2))- methylthiotransferase MtaB n=1 Tax=Desulfurivibrio dismutans TaxID=1398908 RepID=UPI0023DB6006|nr:tRNA (N(6)-L-threonylcarbamoyladenosine(37)-C(2))-methylthiotransferase MtaB [Desulfurivibrio alkaliphilus]MDF1615613.1 tRNA (N(6)-L-threonylcarbamoyladenosine(37)-C(2))-methylthiotransferase MtaB [Desulfurivibrio alkaliphilus]
MAMVGQQSKGKKRVAVTTLGCKVNQYESAAFLSELAGREEVEIVPFTEAAEVYVINTCAVTARAGAQSRQLIRRAARQRGSRLVVTGCYAQVAPQEVLELTSHPLCIVGNSHKNQVTEAVLAAAPCDLEMYLADMAACREVAPLLVRGPGSRTRAVLKVQDGCSQRCSYCIVPISRGPSRSVVPELVLEQAEVYAEHGYREVVLTGIHLGHYGFDLQPTRSLVGLLEKLLARRLPLHYRLSSLESREVTPELLELMAAEESLQPHLHIPLQSGDDRILAAMNRPYRRHDFAAVIRRCAQVLPAAAIGVDVLAGFPGEDDEAFHNTLALLTELPVSYLHVFPYSPRPGTPAAKLPEQVPEKVKQRRTARLRALDRQKRAEFYRRHLGSVRPVLVEGGDKDNAAGRRGFTDNYVPVLLPPGAAESNRIIRVRLAELAEDGVRAVPVVEGNEENGGSGAGVA